MNLESLSFSDEEREEILRIAGEREFERYQKAEAERQRTPYKQLIESAEIAGLDPAIIKEVVESQEYKRQVYPVPTAEKNLFIEPETEQKAVEQPYRFFRENLKSFAGAAAASFMAGIGLTAFGVNLSNPIFHASLVTGIWNLVDYAIPLSPSDYRGKILKRTPGRLTGTALGWTIASILPF
jgi:hypothetical protein